MYCRNPNRVVDNPLIFDTVVNECELQAHSYVHFQTNTLGERIEFPYYPSYRLNIIITVFLKDGFGIK